MSDLFTYIEISIYKDGQLIATTSSNHLTENEAKTSLDIFIFILLKILVYVKDFADFDIYILYRQIDKNIFLDPIKDSIHIMKLLLYRHVKSIKIATDKGNILYNRKDLINRIEFLYKELK